MVLTKGSKLFVIDYDELQREEYEKYNFEQTPERSRRKRLCQMRRDFSQDGAIGVSDRSLMDINRVNDMLKVEVSPETRLNYKINQQGRVVLPGILRDARTSEEVAY